ncbi:hypothetical protein BD414DRAFT_489508 [Trametes punicea]|nr:hypothetical protein BD414DRAFT_489508 [Trametes punicea]
MPTPGLAVIRPSSGCSSLRGPLVRPPCVAFHLWPHAHCPLALLRLAGACVDVLGLRSGVWESGRNILPRHWPYQLSRISATLTQLCAGRRISCSSSSYSALLLRYEMLGRGALDNCSTLIALPERMGSHIVSARSETLFEDLVAQIMRRSNRAHPLPARLLCFLIVTSSGFASLVCSTRA